MPDLNAVADQVAADAFIHAISTIVKEMPYAQTLSQAGIARDAIKMLAIDAMRQQRLMVNNPRDVSLDDVLRLYEAAY